MHPRLRVVHPFAQHVLRDAGEMLYIPYDGSQAFCKGDKMNECAAMDSLTHREGVSETARLQGPLSIRGACHWTARAAAHPGPWTAAAAGSGQCDAVTECVYSEQ